MERLPDAELTVMRAVWRLEPPALTGDIRRELERDREWNLSALQTLLGRLCRRGFLRTEKAGRQRSYTPLVAEEDYLAFENRPYFRGGRGPSVSGLVAALYRSESISAQDLKELRDFLDRTAGREGG